MHRTGFFARILLVPALVLAVAGPVPVASGHSSGGRPEGGTVARASTPSNDTTQFINFETPHVHPIDISPDGLWLAACNTPDGRIEIFSRDAGDGKLVLSDSIPVGVDPVSVRFRTNDEIWAVNMISDTISIIDRTEGQVTDTILTYRLADTGSVLEGSPNGDEPADVVFINSGARAVVSCSRTDVLQLYDTTSFALLDEALRLDGEEPREMATDGTNVWVAIFESGNGTTLVNGIDGTSTAFPPETAIESGTNPYGGDPTGARGRGEYFHDAAPASGTGWNVEGASVVPGDLTQAPPRSSVIVRDDGAGGWLDDNGRDWAAFVDGASAADSGRTMGWTLLDNDIAGVTESSDTLSEDGTFGTSGYVRRQMNIVMSIAQNSNGDGSIFAVGTDATNEVRFEPNITGTFTTVMVSIIDESDGSVIALKDLNAEHLDLANGGSGDGAMAYDSHSVSQSERNKSIGDPRGIAFSSDGSVAYISGMGSNNLVAIDATGGTAGDRISAGYTIEVPEGPTGLVSRGDFLYVMSKFASCIRVIDISTAGAEATVQTKDLFDPTPSAITDGRVHLYGTHENSGLGQIACASCHVDVRMDRLGWNLGNPAGGTPQGIEKPVMGLGDGLLTGGSGTNPLNRHNTLFVSEVVSEASFGSFSSVKGVMTTQTLQDIIGKEPLHWRGDRDGIEEFAGAFEGLQGADAPLGTTEMAEFKGMLASVWFEPNPLRPLDNALPGGPPLSSEFGGNHENLAIPGHLSPGTSTGKGGFSAVGTQLPAGDAFQGFVDYVDLTLDSVFSCVVCHTLPIGAGSTHLINLTSSGTPPTFSSTEIPLSTDGSAHLGMVSNDGTGQPHTKVPQTRNQIDKEGFHLNHGVDSRAGFGVLHDGAIDGTARFLAEPAFDTATDQDLANIVAFTLCIRGDDVLRLQGLSGAPTGGIPPAALDQSAHAAVGAQSVLPQESSTFETDLFMDLASDDEIDIAVETRVSGQPRRYMYYDDSGGARFLSDKTGEGLRDVSQISGVIEEPYDMTFTALHEGTGERIAIDRDEDNLPNGDETDFGSDSTNPNDVAYVEGAGLPGYVTSSLTFSTIAGALSGVTRSSGQSAVIQIRAGSYNEPMTISSPTVLRPVLSQETGTAWGSASVIIGAP